MMIYMGIIEQRINELLQAHLYILQLKQGDTTEKAIRQEKNN